MGERIERKTDQRGGAMESHEKGTGTGTEGEANLLERVVVKDKGLEVQEDSLSQTECFIRGTQ